MTQPQFDTDIRFKGSLGHFLINMGAFDGLKDYRKFFFKPESLLNAPQNSRQITLYRGQNLVASNDPSVSSPPVAYLGPNEYFFVRGLLYSLGRPLMIAEVLERWRHQYEIFYQDQLEFLEHRDPSRAKILCAAISSPREFPGPHLSALEKNLQPLLKMDLLAREDPGEFRTRAITLLYPADPNVAYSLNSKNLANFMVRYEPAFLL